MSENRCQICDGNEIFFHEVDQVAYYQCDSCSSISVDRNFSNNKQKIYDESYWENELNSSKSRAFGGNVIRYAELFLLSRIELKKIIDISSGPGLILDSISTILPNSINNFFAIEPFPPPLKYRTKNKNYNVGNIQDLKSKFDGGCCIEVIEHLNYDQLCDLVKKLAMISNDGACYYFNSGQPSFVQNNLSYLDPFGRGHIASYSLKALEMIFSKYEFRLFELPSRDYGFVVEYKSKNKQYDLIHRIGNPNKKNIENIYKNEYGQLFYEMGLVSLLHTHSESLIKPNNHNHNESRYHLFIRLLKKIIYKLRNKI